LPGVTIATTYRALTERALDFILRRAGLPADERLRMRAVASVLPFRTNEYVVEELIDWAAGADDPIFRLTFPQPGMLAPADLGRMVRLLRSGAPDAQVRAAANEIRSRLNPHPAGQVDANEPILDGRRITGVQHKYAETLLIFPRPGQTCHAYCQYCFRWPQFVGEPSLKIATDDMGATLQYLRAHPEITDVLITGGDPLIMSADVLRRCVEPLLDVPTIDAIRIGTKSLSYWPHRFVTDPDADDLLRLFDRVTASGRQLAVMAHITHPREMRPDVVATAIRRIRDTGAVIRCQAPLIRGINDDPEVLVTLWQGMTKAGLVPYYLFVERDTGPQQFFAVPLVRAYAVFRDAYARVSGLARTVRGPVMSAHPGKVCIDGVAEIAGERVFVLRYLQAREPRLVGRPFFATADPDAIWFSDLKPALGLTELSPELNLPYGIACP
jgi:KamA family protein